MNQDTKMRAFGRRLNKTKNNIIVRVETTEYLSLTEDIEIFPEKKPQNWQKGKIC
jgi:hypothetical protein